MLADISLFVFAISNAVLVWRFERIVNRLHGLERHVALMRMELQDIKFMRITQGYESPKIQVQAHPSTQMTPATKNAWTNEQRAKQAQIKKEWWAKKKASTTAEATINQAEAASEA